MFETGKRELPMAASILLFEILAQVEPAKQLAKHNPDARAAAEKQKQIDHLLKENAFRQMEVSRKMAVISKKHELQRNAVVFADLLKQAEKLKYNDSLCDAVFSKASNAKTAKNVTALVKLQIQQGLLANEQKWLESQLQEQPK